MKWGQGHVYYFYESEMVTPCVPVLETCTCRGTWEKKTEPRLESVTPMYAQCMVWFKWTLLRRQSWKIFSQITWHLNVLCYIHRMNDQLIKSKHLPPTFTKCGRTHVHMQPEGFTSDVESFRLLSKQGFLVDGDSLCLAFPCSYKDDNLCWALLIYPGFKELEQPSRPQSYQTEWKFSCLSKFSSVQVQIWMYKLVKCCSWLVCM